MRRPSTVLLLPLIALGTGCTRPTHEDHSSLLRKSILTAIDRELKELPPPSNSSDTAPGEATPAVNRIEALGLSQEILQQLEQSSGPNSYRGLFKIGAALDGQPQKTVKVNLLRALLTTANNNLTLEFARLVPSIGQTRLAAAEAAFDWTLVASFQYQNQDNASVRSTGFGFNPQLNRQVEGSLTAGVRKRLESGGAVVLQNGNSYSDNNSPGLFPTPNPGDAVNIVAQIDQPLLRNFGSDAALAEVRLARNAERDNIQQLKATIIQQLVDAETGYWQLVRARGELGIASRLLDKGLDVSDTLKKRQATAKDVRASQFSDAVATVEARRSDVLRAENSYRLSSDRLKQLMNDPDLTVGSEVLIDPVDEPVTQVLSFTLRDVLTATLQNRPEVQRALLAISDADLRKHLADNQRLPALDLRLQTRVSELRDNFDVAYSKLANAKFIDYLVGLNYEQPIGNRAAEAGYRQRQLELMQARTTYAEVVQRVLVDVKGALRSVVTNASLIEQTRASRLAAAENLRTLEVEEKTIQSLTPEFLDLKLRRQQALASAEAQELAALTEYNAAVARLYGAMGTILERNRIKFDAPPPDTATEVKP